MMTDTTRRYATMAEIREANRAGDFHFFDRDTMRFFRTKIEGGPYGGRYFVTSEQGPDATIWEGKRRYSVRMAKDDGSIDTVGEFGGYAFKHAAIDAAKALAHS